MEFEGFGWLAIAAPQMPSANHVAREVAPAARTWPRDTSRNAPPMDRIATASPNAKNIRVDTIRGISGKEPIAMPQAKAATMAMAGIFIRYAATGPMLRCDRSGEKDRRSPSR